MTLALSHLWLVPVRCRALGLRTSHAAWDDCVQEGNIALLKAEARFEPERGSFEAYARPWVDNAVKEFFCTQGAVREPIRRVKERISRGEVAHAPALRDVEGLIFDDDSEESMLDAIDTDRRATTLRSHLARVPLNERAAAVAEAWDVGVGELAQRIGACRESVRTWRNAAFEKIRQAATSPLHLVANDADNLFCQAVQLCVSGSRQLGWPWAAVRRWKPDVRQSAPTRPRLIVPAACRRYRERIESGRQMAWQWIALEAA